MIDRAIQRRILETLSLAYPAESNANETLNLSWNEFSANAFYLREWGLCDFKVATQVQPGVVRFGAQRITAKGLDFLAEDGGLGAILGVVTVRLHADTVRDLIAARVDASDLPEPEKGKIKQQLAALPETALREATTSLLHAGIQHVPNLLVWLQTYVGL